VQQGPDGAIYVLAEARRGSILRISPAPGG
jgi:glucose/arabinose dehydrogenase